MSDSKGVNRLYLVLVAVFIGTGYMLARVIPVEVPLYASLIISQSVVLVPALLYCWKRKVSVKELIPHRKIRFSTGVLVVVTTYLMYPLMIVLNAVTLLFTDSAVAGMQSGLLDINFLVATLLIAVVPACVEEFVFRGVLFQTYRKKRVFSAIILSGFLFGCMHMNLNQFAYAFFMGIYAAFLVEATGSIFSSILAHFTLNFTGVMLSGILKILYKGDEMSPVLEQTGNFLQNDRMYVFMMLIGILVWFVIAVGTTVGAVAIYIHICKKNGRWEHMKTIFRKEKEERMITIPLILAVTVAIVEIIISI